MKCDYCGKQRTTGHKVSHSNIKTKRRKSANIQRVHALVDGTKRRMHACTRCIRSGAVQKHA